MMKFIRDTMGKTRGQVKTITLIKQLLRRVDRGFGKWRCKEVDLDCAACRAELLRSGLRWWYDLEIWDGKIKSRKVYKVKS